MISFRRWRMISVLSLAGALALVAGCSGEEGSTQAPETAEGAQALSQEGQSEDGPAGAHARRPPRGPGGPDFLLVAALRELELTPAQTATIQGALDKTAAGPRDRGPKDRAPLAALAAGVRAGKVDPSAVLASAGADQGGEEHRAAVASALQTLHATLTPEQRRALVDSVTKRMEEHGAPGKGPGKGGPGKGGPGKGGHKAGGPPRDGEGPAGRGVGGPLGHLLRDLDLTDAQRETIARALEAQRPAPAEREVGKERFEARRAEVRARLEGFAAATFDAKAFAAPPGGAEARGPKEHLERMAKDLAVVVPVLEPAQREALAARLEKGPPMKH